MNLNKYKRTTYGSIVEETIDYYPFGTHTAPGYQTVVIILTRMNRIQILELQTISFILRLTW